ncbi:MAG TPA: fumarylacetoacetase [Acetobacteraceae bacterium]|jgi:fumarylacetoacetase|nr:fumarylacetoacetase [Acetobacteraceae bacterium]
MTDATHDPTRLSWVASANGHTEFPIQNLPFGVFSTHGGRPRGGVAIGDAILDIGATLGAGLFTGVARDAAEAAAGPELNPLLALPATARRALRQRLSDILATGSDARGKASHLLHDATACTLHLPAQVGDYTDFFAGIHHARKGGQISRPDNPLMPNYKYVPVAYHSRASSVRPSGEDVRRPNGQRKLPNEAMPTFGPCRNLDYELELGVWIGHGNRQDEAIPIGQAAQHIAGFCLLNDWSARDIQSWESQPLGPFLGKSFRTSVSPWIITSEALEPFRIAQPARPDGDPAPLSHLLDAADQAHGALDIDCEVFLSTPAMRAASVEPHRMCRSNTRELYWTVAQMVAHHASNGCNLRPGDLFGSGTISGTDATSIGCLLEMTFGGRDSITLTNGETRRYLEDDDEVIFRAHCRRPGAVTIGLGECRGRVVAGS